MQGPPPVLTARPLGLSPPSENGVDCHGARKKKGGKVGYPRRRQRAPTVHGSGPGQEVSTSLLREG